MLRKRQGLPQLIGLGVLFIIAASFFAVQLWTGVSAPRGAVSALQPPPTMPPSYRETAKSEPAPMPEPDSGFIEVVDFEAEASEVEVVEAPVEVVVEPAVVEPPVKAINDKQLVTKVAPAPVQKQVESEKLPQVDVSKAKQVEFKPQNVEKTSVPAKPEVAPARFIEAPPIKESRSTVSSVPVVSARRVVRTPEAIPTEIPPEWNWFSKPLKVEISEGKLSIVAADKAAEIKLVADKETVPTSIHEEAPISLPDATGAVELVVIEPVVEKIVAVESPAIDSQAEPFQEAVSKMQKARSDRARREQARSYSVRTLDTTAVRPSKSMMRVRDYLGYMKSASAYERALIIDFSPAQDISTGSEAPEATAVTAATDTVSDASAIAGVRPYRAESGSVEAFRLRRSILRR